MAATAEQLLQYEQTTQLNHYERIWTDTATWVAEALHGSMRTSFEYRFDGQELYGEDGGALGEIFDDAITAAEVIVSQKPNLAFELRRRLIEHEEYEDMLRMMRGELPNTMVVVSDFPPELRTADEDVGGYNVNRQQTMLRVITRQDDGSLRMTTQSLDRSNRCGLEAIYRACGREAGGEELLPERIYYELSSANQARLTDDLTSIYDAKLAEQLGGSWHAGIRQTGQQRAVDTYEFARAQTDLINWFTAAKLSDSTGAEKLRYSLVATVDARYQSYLDRASEIANHLSAPQAVPAYVDWQPERPMNMYQEIKQATQQASAQGKTFSGCGSTVRTPGESTIEGQLSEAGYGNRSSEKTTYKFDRKAFCRVCQAPPKKGESQKKCGPCQICEPCDKKMSSKPGA